MSGSKEEERGISEAKVPTQQQPQLEEDITPGREPAEGPVIAYMSPSHESSEHHTADLDPVEGAEEKSGSAEGSEKE